MPRAHLLAKLRWARGTGERNLEILGEASKRVSKSVRARAPEIPMARDSRNGDKLIHGYFGVDLNLVWNVVASELPNARNHSQS